MTVDEHLHLSDILAFRERRLSADDRTVATRHLLQCAECRDRLPVPTADELWRCLMGSDEGTIEARSFGSAWLSAKDYLAGIIFGRSAIRNAVLAALFLFAILSFSLFLMPTVSPVDEDLIAAATRGNPPYAPDPVQPDGPIRKEASITEVSTPSLGSNRQDSEANDRRPPKAVIASAKQAVPKTSHHAFTTTRSPRRADTRGRAPCGEQRSVGLLARRTEAGLLLKWDKIEGAVSYNVYLSDLDERLVDHIETTYNTSHLVTAELDKETVYRLRLIAKRESGERIVSESRNFKLGDLGDGSSRSKGDTGSRKTAATVRCLEVKQ